MTRHHFTFDRIIVLVALAALLACNVAFPTRSSAAGQLGDGRPESCTEAALRTALAAGGAITFNCGPNPVTITLSAQVEVTQDTTLDGSGSRLGGMVALSGGGSTPVIRVRSGKKFTLRNITVRDGRNVAGGGLWAEAYCNITIVNARFVNNDGTVDGRESGGGAITMWQGGTLTIQNSDFTGNKGVNGGAIYNLTSSLLESNSTFTNNTAVSGRANPYTPEAVYGAGGAIYIDGASYPAGNSTGGKVAITDSIFVGNRAESQGGAMHSYLYSADSMTVERSMFVDNGAVATGSYNSLGGAIRHGTGRLSINDTLFAYNKTSGDGGAIWKTGEGEGSIVNTTFVGNRADDEGGALLIYDSTYSLANTTFADNQAGTRAGAIMGTPTSVMLKNAIFANNRVGNGGQPTDHCNMTLGAGGKNMQTAAGGEPCAPGISSADAQLGSLGPNGGATLTMALAEGSPAIGAGSDCPATDQRGAARSGRCDLGAYTYGVSAPSPTLPDAPSQLAVNDSGSVVQLRWEAVNRATRYEVLVEGGKLTGAPMATTADTFTELALDRGVYTLRVQACNPTGCGAPSAPAQVAVDVSLQRLYLPLTRR